MTTAQLDRLTHSCHVLETGNDSFRFMASTATPRGRATRPDMRTKPMWNRAGWLDVAVPDGRVGNSESGKIDDGGPVDLMPMGHAAAGPQAQAFDGERPRRS
ncbi:hypothetical protein V8J39_13845 [Frigidibacter sp. MR17.24]